MRNSSFIVLIIVSLTLLCTCVPRLMPYKKFAKLEEMKFPKLLELTSGTKQLLYFGTYHANDPNDPLYPKLRQSMEQLSPEFVLHEGGSNWPICKDIDSTILISGEPGFIIQLSQEKGIAYSTLEPAERDEYAALLEQYPLNWVVLMYVCRQIDQQQRFAVSYGTTDEDFLKNINYFLAMLLEDGVPLSTEQLGFEYWQRTYQSLLGQALNWRTFNPELYYPNQYLTKLNEINRASDEFRNLHMVEEIMSRLKDHDRVLVLVGGGHLIVQEKLLRFRFENSFR